MCSTVETQGQPQFVHASTATTKNPKHLKPVLFPTPPTHTYQQRQPERCRLVTATRESGSAIANDDDNDDELTDLPPRVDVLPLVTARCTSGSGSGCGRIVPVHSPELLLTSPAVISSVLPLTSL